PSPVPLTPRPAAKLTSSFVCIQTTSQSTTLGIPPSHPHHCYGQQILLVCFHGSILLSLVFDQASFLLFSQSLLPWGMEHA
ncbi:hypothetical protein AVEN_79970-1, partial [Araneus ventricosus]